MELKDKSLLVAIKSNSGFYNHSQMEGLFTFAKEHKLLTKPLESTSIGLIIKSQLLEKAKEVFSPLGLEILEYRKDRAPIASCIGSLCPYAKQNVSDLHMKLEQILQKTNLKTRDIKIGINGCSKTCVETSFYDIAVLASQDGYEVRLGGRSANSLESGRIFLEKIPSSEILEKIQNLLEFFEINSDEDESVYDCHNRHNMFASNQPSEHENENESEHENEINEDDLNNLTKSTNMVDQASNPKSNNEDDDLFNSIDIFDDEEEKNNPEIKKEPTFDMESEAIVDDFAIETENTSNKEEPDLGDLEPEEIEDFDVKKKDLNSSLEIEEEKFLNTPDNEDILIGYKKSTDSQSSNLSSDDELDLDFELPEGILEGEPVPLDDEPTKAKKDEKISEEDLEIEGLEDFSFDEEITKPSMDTNFEIEEIPLAEDTEITDKISTKDLEDEIESNSSEEEIALEEKLSSAIDEVEQVRVEDQNEEQRTSVLENNFDILPANESSNNNEIEEELSNKPTETEENHKWQVSSVNQEDQELIIEFQSGASVRIDMSSISEHSRSISIGSTTLNIETTNEYIQVKIDGLIIRFPC